MPPVRVVTSGEGPRLEVNQLIRDPLLIPQRILSMLNQKFIADQLLRYAGDAPGGVVTWWQTPPLFTDLDAEVVAERAEIPLTPSSVGTPNQTATKKRALGIAISDEMVRRNRIDQVNRQLDLVRNTIIRAIDGTFFNALLAAPANVLATGVAWSAATATHIRKDLAQAMQLIVDTRRGYTPDTLVINPTTATDLLSSDEMNRVYQGAVAGQNPAIAGQLPGQIFGLNVLVGYAVPAGQALVLERKTIGGIADEVPLQATELYRDNPTETNRSDVKRESAVFVDEPLAATWIQGV